MPLWHDRVDDHEQQQCAAHTARRNKTRTGAASGDHVIDAAEIATHSATNRSEWREAKRKGPEGCSVARRESSKGSHMVRSCFNQPRCPVAVGTDSTSTVPAPSSLETVR